MYNWWHYNRAPTVSRLTADWHSDHCCRYVKYLMLFCFYSCKVWFSLHFQSLIFLSFFSLFFLQHTFLLLSLSHWNQTYKMKFSFNPLSYTLSFLSSHRLHLLCQCVVFAIKMIPCFLSLVLGCLSVFTHCLMKWFHSSVSVCFYFSKKFYLFKVSCCINDCLHPVWWWYGALLWYTWEIILQQYSPVRYMGAVHMYLELHRCTCLLGLRTARRGWDASQCTPWCGDAMILQTCVGMWYYLHVVFC